SGRIHLKVEPISLRDSIADAVATFQAVLAQSGRTVKADVPDDLPDVAGDRDRVNQVLINFISNAIKYSPEGGDVTVTAKGADGAVMVSVTDEGLGISVEDQKLLFQKFFRVDSAITREIGGTGLGLSICKSIIELLGGSIGVKSKLGQGSTFYFTLPVAAADLVRMPKVAGPEGAHGTVLVVDRDPEIAALIETYLSRHGYDVVQAHSAEEAIETARRVQPSVITLDVILDDADGFELLQRFKEQPETADIPVVVLSIVCDEGKSCRFGAANYLEKPIDQDRLISIVDDLVGSKTSPLALVADDDRSIVKMLSETLRRRGFAVAAAYDGTEAIAAIEQHKPDIVLLDLRMPRMDGYEVLKRVKSKSEWADIPIVVMTAYQIDSEQIDLINLAAGRIAKPMSPEEIAAKVDELLTAQMTTEAS
ncbi:MAG: response regulator, partial [Coriobacteriales bacterium]|nr:response regulator [Coriobacteriales bacterium]